MAKRPSPSVSAERDMPLAALTIATVAWAMGRPSGSSTVPRMAPVEASCDRTRTLNSKQPSTMATRAKWRRADGMSPTSNGMGLGRGWETGEFYHCGKDGRCVGGHKFVCVLRVSTGKGKMSYYHLRTANCPACRRARRLCSGVNRHENSAIDRWCDSLLLHLVARPFWPLNLLENSTEALSFGGIDRLEECHPAQQMRTKLRMKLAILSSGAVADAIGQDGLETVKIGARDIHVLIRHNSSQMLAHAPPHDACLAVIHRKSFFQQDRSHMNRESIHVSCEGLVAREREIVGVTRVFGADRSC